MDVEDLGTMVGKMNEAKTNRIIQEPKEMITPLLRKALTKQGTAVFQYCIILLCFHFSRIFQFLL
jgi:hypothetical protein